MKSGDIDNLLVAAAFPHPVERLECIETHISWVILTGSFAYKIKKPVDLGFVDFTTLALRKHFCQEELRLNQRTAPDIYLDVVPIAKTAQGLTVGLEPAVEYAVRMQQFPGDARLDRQLESGRLGNADVLAMAESIAAFHASLKPERVDDAAEESRRISQFALDNFCQIRHALNDDSFHPLLSRLETWTRRQSHLLESAFRNRAIAGFIREGHGDLHLANMVKLKDRIELFDCLEFDPDLRCIDLMNDVAFLVMDLTAHGREDLALIFLNAYLEKTGDYPGLAVLRFYLVYRCLVRAKVAALQPSDNTERGLDSKTRRYLELAQSLVEHAIAPRLFLMHGYSGSGKSWLSNRLIPALSAIRLRSDLERKRLHGLAAAESSASGIESGLYDKNATERTYDCLAQYCRTGLQAGFTIIVDASFLHRRQRERFLDLASQLQVDVCILDCIASPGILRRRIRKRAEDPQQVSEAGLAVLEHQIAHHDPFTDLEKRYVVPVQMNEEPDFPALLRRLV